ncbi:MAG: hypothetical protein P8100_05425 [bacterium]|jgi:cell division protein FtsQ
MIRIIKISLFVVFIAAVLSLMGFIYIENGNQPIREIIVRIDREGDRGFLDKIQLTELIESNDSISRKTIREIHVASIEKLISRNVFVFQVDAYINLERNLIVNIMEQTPLVRIFPRHSDGFYISKEGNMFPLSDRYTSRVLIANGYLETTYRKDHRDIFDTIYEGQQLTDIYRLAKLISANPFLRAQISQIYVNSRKEFDLIPELGEHIIRMGTMENVEDKLANLETWYKKAMTKEDWNKYKIINIKYKNQVVCTQN